jgi:glycosyltransferase involved in cell wall biosynthesis
VNGIYENCILLPEFILPDEEIYYEKLIKQLQKEYRDDKEVIKISTYTSFARSPRLLNAQHVEYLMKMVSKQINKNVELIVIDPRAKTETIKSIGNITIRYIKPLPRIRFLKLVSNSDLFIELNIDEELRDSTLEAALLGTPVAKLTHPLFKDRCDYIEDSLIQAYSFEELANKISEYIQNIEFYYNTYSNALRDFVLKFRTWNYVKRQLVEYLKEA